MAGEVWGYPKRVVIGREVEVDPPKRRRTDIPPPRPPDVRRIARAIAMAGGKG